MSLYGAMFSGVTGLNAQTQSMAMISDNVANVNTTGYKEVSARFSTLVTNSISQGLYTSGGVRSLPLQIQDRQGLLQGSATSTDIAVNGDGFFVVSTVPNPEGTAGEYFFTRAGSFRPDDQGNLVNTAGMYLQAWPYNSQADNTNSALTDDGVVFGTDGLPVNKTDLGNVEPVNLADLTGVAEATTAVELRINLDASQPQQATAIDYLSRGGGLGGIDTAISDINASQLVNMRTMSGGETVPDFQRSITVYDAQGVSHDFQMSFLKKGVDPNAPTLTETVTSTSTTGSGTTLVVPALVGRTDIPAAGQFTYGNATATGFGAGGSREYANFDPNTGTFTINVDTVAPIDPLLEPVWSGPSTADITFPVYQSVANRWAVELSSSDAYNNVEVEQISGTAATFGAVVGGNYPLTIDMSGFGSLNDILLDGEVDNGGGSLSYPSFNSGTTEEQDLLDSIMSGGLTYTSVERSGTDLIFQVPQEYFTAIDPTTISGGVFTNAVVNDLSLVRNTVHQDGIIGFGEIQFNTDGSLDSNNSIMYVANYESSAALGSTSDVVYTRTPLLTAGNYEIAWNPNSTGASGSDLSALSPQNITSIDFGTNGQTDGLSQFQGASTLYSHDVDGALFGNFVGVTIDNEGWVVANFSNGLSQRTHRIPLATVPNPAALANETGNAYRPTAESGSFNLNEPGTGNAGLIAGAALEASTVDLGTEFTNMIITQRAYSATSRIITTADEMLDELVRLKR